jgi:hypothetical protein
VSGTVLEFTATGEVRPVPNLRLKVRAGSRDGAVGGAQLADTVTDAQGRYTITDVSAWVLFFQTAPESEYRSLCDAYPVAAQRTASGFGFPFTDLPVVHTSWSGNQLPRNMWIIGTSVWGTVSEQVNGSLQAVADATVSFDGGIQDPPATTSATGFYMICSIVGTDQTRTISAHKSGYNQVNRDIVGGYERVFNFELTRR